MLAFGLKKAEAPPDESHPYGHEKAECLATFGMGIILLFLAVVLIVRSISSLVGGSHPVPGKIALVVAGISILSKLGLGFYLKSMGKKLKSHGLGAGSAHAFTDSMTSVAALVGIYLARAGFPLADPIVAGLVALVVGGIGFKIVYRASQGLMDRGAPPELVGKISKFASAFPGVWGVHNIRTRICGGGFRMDIHVEVGPKLPVENAHRLGHEIENAIIGEFEEIEEVIVHIEPFVPHSDTDEV